MKRAASSFSAGSSALTAFSSAFAAAARRADSDRRRRTVGQQRLLGRTLQSATARASPRSISASRAENSAATAGEVVDRHLVLARGGAQREQPLLGALQLARIEVAVRASPPPARAAPPPDGRAPRREPRACRSSRPGTSADFRSRRRARPTSSGTGEALPPTSSCASLRSPAIFSARIRNCRRSASAASSPGFRRKRLKLLHGGAQIVGVAVRRFQRGAQLGRLSPRARAARDSGRLPPRRPASSRPNASSRRRCSSAPTSARSSCWPWISTSIAPISLRSETPQGWSLTKARVLPSAVCTRRRMSAPSASMSFSASSANDRMIGRRLEDRRDLAALRAGAHQRRVAARAERQRQRIEQDGFAGARLAGQHRQPGVELDAEPVDQDDVLDGEAREHRQPRAATPGRTPGRSRSPCSPAAASPPLFRSA